MDKQHLLSVIDKYHLNGIVERTKWNISNDMLSIKFVSENKDLVGEILSNGFKELDGQELPIFNTSQLYKFINITGQFLTLSYKKDMKSHKLLIADNQYNLEYILGDPARVPKGAEVGEPEYPIEFTITRELIEGYIKAKKALSEAGIVTLESAYDETSNQIIRFTIGNNDAYAHKIIFNSPATKMDIPSNPITFNGEYLREIFNNNKDFTIGNGYLSEEGLLKIKFTNEAGVESTYFMVAQE